ncbi:uncharacterized protein LOC132639840 [Lycium barbarum]|uniref:uncharacterized protein LOC132639840 n=1 Tax=Lycium barbarum TaxID=112863 RepID=UPI00293EB332|nr:uncharacterized protein LOC132639840 [Lycium barbarum]
MDGDRKKKHWCAWFDLCLPTNEGGAGFSKGNPGSAGGGGIIRDQTGSMIQAFTEYYGQSSNNIAEANAMLKGIKIYLNAGLSNIVVESKSLWLINIINEKLDPPWQIKQIIEQITSITSAGNFTFAHIFREGNFTADLLANMRENSKSFSIFTEATFPPLKVRASMKLEFDGLPNFRHRKKNKFISDFS